MAIDPKELENVRPTSSAVDKLKARKNRIKPWQTPSGDSAAVVSAPEASEIRPATAIDETADLRHTAGLKAPIASDSTAAGTPVTDIPFSVPERFSATPKNTDKIPTTKVDPSVAPSQPSTSGYRQNTDNEKRSGDLGTSQTGPNSNLTDTESLSTSTDKVPTKRLAESGDVEQYRPSLSESADKVPTTGIETDFPQRFERAQKKSIQQKSNTDKVPTTKLDGPPKPAKPSTDKIPAKNRQRLASTDKTLGESKSTDKVPAKSQQNTDKEPTIVPTTEIAFVGTNTDNEIGLTPIIIEQRFKDLSGGQLQFLMFCYRECVARGSNSFATTYPDLAKATSIKESSIRTTAKIVKGRGLVEITFKKGPGGRIEIIIPEMVFRVITRNQANHAWSTDKVPTTFEPEYRQNTDHSADKIAPSKLVSDLNSSYSLTTAAYDGFDSIDLTPAQNLGITRKHIQDIKNQRLTVTRFQLEDFIARFGLYASKPENVRTVKNIPALFIRMVQLLAQGEDPLLDIETPEEAHLKQLLERQQSKREAKLKLEQELAAGEFETWIGELTQSDRDNFAPPNSASPAGSIQQRMLLKAYFVEHIWPSRLNDLFKS